MAGGLRNPTRILISLLAIHWVSVPGDWAALPEIHSMVDYIGLERVQELVARVGAARFIEGLAAEIEADYRRWRDFDKSPRHATHSDVGVIELMPTSDGKLYSFKYVNGHPKNTAQGLLTVT